MIRVARKYTTHSPTCLAKCQPKKVDDADLKRMMRNADQTFVLGKIIHITDPALRDHAMKIYDAVYITH